MKVPHKRGNKESMLCYLCYGIKISIIVLFIIITINNYYDDDDFSIIIKMKLTQHH